MDHIRTKGGFYAGCQILMRDGRACQGPVEAFVVLDEDMCIVVCAEHVLPFEAQLATAQ